MNKIQYKLLVLDIDGTLLDRRGALTEADREAIHKVREMGIGVALSTGRATNACMDIMAKLSLDGFHIFFDGALACNPHKNHEVYAEPIAPDVMKEAINHCRQAGIPLELYSAAHYFTEMESWRTDIHTRFFNFSPTIVDFSEVWKRERIIKGGIVVATGEEADKVRDFSREFKGRLELAWAKTPAFPELSFVNVLASGVSKGRALEALASHLNVSMTQVMAIGDGLNDISLLSAAGTAVAMRTAVAEVKAVADYVTSDVEHSGVAEAVNKFILQ